MCMRIGKEQKIETAAEPILVYKIFRRKTDAKGKEHWQSPYMLEDIKKPCDGMVLTPKCKNIDRHKNIIKDDDSEVVGKGLVYAYTEYNYINLDYIGMTDCHVYTCIIPEGTEYIISMDGMNIGAKKLVITGSMPIKSN